jgi:peptide/nickel transport system ATP-binding protein
MSGDTLLSVKDLQLFFRTTHGIVRAVDGVDFELARNRAVVIVGESGCGKTSMAKAILRLLPKNVDTYSGKIMLNGLDTMTLKDEEYRLKMRWVKMSMVPQAAMNSLNPVLKVGDQVAEPAIIHNDMSKDVAMQQAKTMFQHVGVPLDFLTGMPLNSAAGCASGWRLPCRWCRCQSWWCWTSPPLRWMSSPRLTSSMCSNASKRTWG